MISFIKTIIYQPLYNFLILILNIPYVDAGVAVVILIILVKLLLFPLAKKTYITQFKMKGASKELAAIKEKYKDRETQAVKVMEFYKKNNINPFGSILGIIIQIPIIYSLYHIFLQSGLPNVDMGLLYSFIKVPESVSMNFLGFVDISKNSIIFALLAAVSSFAQMHYSGLSTQNKNEPTDKQDLSAIMGKQMKYTFPVIVFFISWKIAAVLSLYWVASNLVGMVQDYIIKKSFVANSQQPKEAINLVSKN